MTAAVIVVLDSGATGHSPDAGKLAANLPVTVLWARRETEGRVTCLAARVESPESAPCLRQQAVAWGAANGWAVTVAPC